jgi:hypothetical protein
MGEVTCFIFPPVRELKAQLLLLSASQNVSVLCSSYLCVFWVGQKYHQCVSEPDSHDGSMFPYYTVRIFKDTWNALISVTQNSELHTSGSFEHIVHWRKTEIIRNLNFASD